MDNHEIVCERINNFLNINGISTIKTINLFGHNTADEKAKYISYLENRENIQDEKVFEPHALSCYERKDGDPKVIAWYLPQYHRIDINDKNYGRGFTEWTNTTKAIPQFVGHHQPHIPIDLGYYSLNDPETIKRQVELANYYGVYGFSYYYYWFSGKTIMSEPLDYLREHPELDIHYCITWANENWSSLWDGGDKEVICKQELQEDDDYKIIDDLETYFMDDRYITINEKKVFILYNPELWSKERVKKLFSNMRQRACEKGIGGLYIMICNARGFDEDVETWGADAYVEFPPHGIIQYTPSKRIDGYLNPKFSGQIRSTDDFIQKKKYLCDHKSRCFYRGAMPSWDNTSRKTNSGATVFTGLTPKSFEMWIYNILDESKRIHSAEENIVFVNAWNEWAEGAHLEPDMMYGYANLIAIKNAIEKTRSN
jgi:lipopolysaccharide biosynthesis protein